MWKYVKQEGQANGISSNLSVKDIKAAQNLTSNYKALNVAASSKSQKQGQYNSHSPEQCAKIGKYAAEIPGSKALHCSLGY